MKHRNSRKSKSVWFSLKCLLFLTLAACFIEYFNEAKTFYRITSIESRKDNDLVFIDPHLSSSPRKNNKDDELDVVKSSHQQHTNNITNTHQKEGNLLEVAESLEKTDAMEPVPLKTTKVDEEALLATQKTTKVEEGKEREIVKKPPSQKTTKVEEDKEREIVKKPPSQKTTIGNNVNDEVLGLEQPATSISDPAGNKNIEAEVFDQKVTKTANTTTMNTTLPMIVVIPTSNNTTTKTASNLTSLVNEQQTKTKNMNNTRKEGNIVAEEKVVELYTAGKKNTSDNSKGETETNKNNNKAIVVHFPTTNKPTTTTMSSSQKKTTKTLFEQRHPPHFNGTTWFRFKSHGLGVDLNYIAVNLVKAIAQNKTLRVKFGQGHWIYSKDVCPQQDLSCYFEDPILDPPPSTVEETVLRLVVPKPEFQADIDKANVTSPGNCSVIHVRHSDVILNTGWGKNKTKPQYKYIQLGEYVDLFKKETTPDIKNIVLLTDDQDVIDDIQNYDGKEGDEDGLKFHYLKRPRFRGAEGGWENHFPNENRYEEMLNIFRELQLVSKCKLWVGTKSKFASVLQKLMPKPPKIVLLDNRVPT